MWTTSDEIKFPRYSGDFIDCYAFSGAYRYMVLWNEAREFCFPVDTWEPHVRIKWSDTKVTLFDDQNAAIMTTIARGV